MITNFEKKKRNMSGRSVTSESPLLSSLRTQGMILVRQITRHRKARENTTAVVDQSKLNPHGISFDKVVRIALSKVSDPTGRCRELRLRLCLQYPLRVQVMTWMTDHAPQEGKITSVMACGSAIDVKGGDPFGLSYQLTLTEEAGLQESGRWAWHEWRHEWRRTQEGKKTTVLRSWRVRNRNCKEC